ncbi:MAG: PAS domain-containing protein [Phycisphaeraceae bacterium]|nr:PAS domain-containing protein [Phycisphaeraceae bacterium]QYK49245.1 MAG: PAS domain-containing protein [Phycisphaeraceae bacterium]
MPKKLVLADTTFMRLASRGLSVGERDVAGVGLAMLGVVAGVTVAAAAIATMEIDRLDRVRAIDRVDAAGQTLASAAEELIEQGRLSALRRLVAESVSSGRLGSCQLLIGDGQVVASSDPGEITVVELPDSWPSESVASMADSRSFPVIVPGRGALTLVATSPRGNAEGFLFSNASWIEAASGIGLAGAAGAAVLWTLYRGIRRRVSRQGVICDAVLALGRGETSTEAVRLSSAFGEVAEAWGRVLDQRAEWEVRKDAEAVVATTSTRRGGGATAEVSSGALDAMWQGIVLVGEDMNATYANGAAGLLLEAPREQVVGSSIEGRFASPEIDDAIRAAITGSARRRASFEVRKSEGRTILRVSVRPIRREDGAAALVMIEDVTQQRAAEDARHSFVAQAAHELRTPLTNIRLYVEQAIDASEEDREVRSEALNVINNESQRLERLVQDMLSVAEIESGSMSIQTGDVRLSQLLDDVSRDYVAQAKDKHIALKFELPPKLPVIKGDRDKLSLAIHNIVANALKYTPEGGSVAVKVAWEQDEVRIAVEDTGIGIKQEEQGLIFDKFYRAKDTRIANITGTGLGLTLARDVVRLHGGDIGLKSEDNKGSTFTITLPARAAA